MWQFDPKPVELCVVKRIVVLGIENRSAKLNSLIVNRDNVHVITDDRPAFEDLDVIRGREGRGGMGWDGSIDG